MSLTIVQKGLLLVTIPFLVQVGLITALAWGQQRQLAAHTAALERMRALVAQSLTREERAVLDRHIAVDAEDHDLRGLLVAGTVVSFLATLVLATYFYREVGARMEVLTSNVRHLGAGRPLAAPLSGDDEVGRVDRAFHAMAAELSRRRDETMQGLADAAAMVLMTGRSLDELMLTITGRARTLLGAWRAAATLLVPRHDQGFAREWVADMHGARAGVVDAAGGASVATQVASARRTLLGRNSAAEPGTATEISAANDWVAAPILDRDGGVIGVIEAHERRHGRFSEEDAQVMTQLAQTIAAALELRRAHDALTARAADLADTNADLLQKTRENELFVFSVSHDLRSPLVNLEGFSHELSGTLRSLRDLLTVNEIPDSVRVPGLRLLDSEAAESLQFIDRAVDRLSHIVDGLLRLSRIGQVEYRGQRVELDDIVAPVIDSLHGTMVTKGVTLVRQPLGRAWGDPIAIEQVFANLLDNALKYLDPVRPGLIEIGTVTRRGREDQFRTCFVKDNGVGIPSASQQRVFQPLQRLHHELAPGEGLGLAIVRRIVERHGGQLWLESQEGKGSTFFFELPRRPSAAQPMGGAFVQVGPEDDKVSRRASV
jgi:signal transduction histidine kinase